MTKKRVISLMAVAHGTESTTEVSRKFITGIGAVGILATNPTREESNRIFEVKNPTKTDPIEYLGTTTVKNAKGEDIEVPQIRISFVVETDPAIPCNNGMKIRTTYTHFLSKGYRYSNKNGVLKVQVIDTYGRTGWVTQEELKEHKVPVLTISKGPRAGEKFSPIVANYRPAYIGEPELVQTIIALLALPDVNNWEERDGERIPTLKTDPKELAKSECLLTRVEDYFKGDISEIKEIVEFQPKNRFKVPFGVRTDKDGNLRQTVFTGFPMKLSLMNYSGFERFMIKEHSEDRHLNETYTYGGLVEYSVTPTNYSQTEEAKADPFAAQPALSVESEPVDDMPDFSDPFSV